MILTILSTVLGFAAPFIGDVFKLFTVSGDRKHELEMFKMRIEASSQEHVWKMEEINANADIAEGVATHTPLVSFGVQLLDKAHDAGMPAWVIVPAFWAFVVLDWLTGILRPAITGTVVSFYFFYRWSCIKAAQSVIAGHDFSNALMQTWGENDWAILFMVLAYWFGDRTRQKVKAGK